MANDEFDNSRADKDILRKMNAFDHPPLSLLAKLGSIAVHAEEMMSPTGHESDKVALESVLNDPEVKEWIEVMQQQYLLPEKR